MSDDLCVVDGSVVMRFWWSKELFLFQSRRGLRIDYWKSLALKFHFTQAFSLWYLLVAVRRVL